MLVMLVGCRVSKPLIRGTGRSGPDDVLRMPSVSCIDSIRIIVYALAPQIPK